jgi:pectinesterase
LLYGKSHKKEGWHNWNKTLAEMEAVYAEYNSYGPGTSDETRVSWSHILNETEIKKYTISNILSGNDKWDLEL